MSSFPTHEENILELKRLGFDVEDYLDSDGNVTYESWGYDTLVDIIGEILQVLAKQNFKAGGNT